MSLHRRFEVDAVLFDLDGTLVDSVADLATAANRMLAELAMPPRSIDEIRSFVGKGMANLVRRCLTWSHPPAEPVLEQAIAVFRRHYADVNGDASRVYPGVVETLERMREMSLGLACVTNKPEAFTLPLLRHTGLAPYFPVVVSGDTLAVKKPDPAALLFACSKLGVEPAYALMIGDSNNDALAARAAGIPVLLVSYGYSEDVPVDTIECDGLLSSATEALGLILPPSRQ